MSCDYKCSVDVPRGAWVDQQSVVVVFSDHTHLYFLKLEFRGSEVSPSKAEVKQGKFVECISPGEGLLKRNLLITKHKSHFSYSKVHKSYRSYVKAYTLFFSS